MQVVRVQTSRARISVSSRTGTKWLCVVQSHVDRVANLECNKEGIYKDEIDICSDKLIIGFIIEEHKSNFENL